MKTKIDFLEQIELKVKDIAGDLTKTAFIQQPGEVKEGYTYFTVDSSEGFVINDVIYLINNTGNAVFSRVIEVKIPDVIVVNGDQSVFGKGAIIKKSDAVQFLDEAITVYSKYNPRVRTLVVNVSMPGNEFSLPVDWESGFSKTNSVEYPVGYFPQYFLNPDDYGVVTGDGTNYILKFERMIYSDFKIEYFIQHSIDAENSPMCTIPGCDFYCVCNIAAAFYLLALANRFSENVNPTIGASSMNIDDKSKKYRAAAGDMFSQAASWLGLNVNVNDGMIPEQVPFSSDQGAGRCRH
ncbi:MAG: hypothetical protein ACHQJ4_04740 [Ignavibacteria bacterium]